MSDDELIARLTSVVRRADKDFEKVGGDTRHWVRECFLPRLEEERFAVAFDDGSFIPRETCLSDTTSVPAEGVEKEPRG